MDIITEVLKYNAIVGRCAEEGRRREKRGEIRVT